MTGIQVKLYVQKTLSALPHIVCLRVDKMPFTRREWHFFEVMEGREPLCVMVRAGKLDTG